jgi:uncharacterized protein (DUF1684 family)
MEVASMLRGLGGLLALALAFFPICWTSSAPAQVAAAQNTPSLATPTADANASWLLDLDAWHAQREYDLAAPGGWLTLVGLEWLKPGINSFGAAPDNAIRLHAQAPDHIGLLTVSGTSTSGQIVQLLAPSGGFPPQLTLDGGPAREGSLSTSDERPATIAWHGLSMVVLRRGSGCVLRIKDADSPARTGFHGLHWYAPDPRYRVTARWIPYKPPQVEKIPTVIGTTLDMKAPGVAEFIVSGKVFILEPVIEGNDTSKLLFILSDETSKTASYEGGRLLNAGLPDHGLGQPGSITLDFNRLYNPPCAYTSFATCPLPPIKNRLPVALEAGEKRYTP